MRCGEYPNNSAMVASELERVVEIQTTEGCEHAILHPGPRPRHDYRPGLRIEQAAVPMLPVQIFHLPPCEIKAFRS